MAFRNQSSILTPGFNNGGVGRFFAIKKLFTTTYMLASIVMHSELVSRIPLISLGNFRSGNLNEDVVQRWSDHFEMTDNTLRGQRL